MKVEHITTCESHDIGISRIGLLWWILLEPLAVS